MKHTEGPWEIRIGKDQCFHDTNRVAIVKVHKCEDDGEVEITEETIAEVWKAAEDADIADGYLITAAPDMLDALQTIFDNSQKKEHSFAIDIDHIAAVLRKAKGERDV